MAMDLGDHKMVDDRFEKVIDLLAEIRDLLKQKPQTTSPQPLPCAPESGGVKK